eukprot:6030482-Amphidinium_carterae.2
MGQRKERKQKAVEKAAANAAREASLPRVAEDQVMEVDSGPSASAAAEATTYGVIDASQNLTSLPHDHCMRDIPVMRGRVPVLLILLELATETGAFLEETEYASSVGLAMAFEPEVTTWAGLLSLSCERIFALGLQPRGSK